MIIRHMPATAVVTVDRLAPGDQLWGHTLGNGSWRLFSTAAKITAVNPSYVYGQPGAAIEWPDGSSEVVLLITGGHVLITYSNPGRPRTAADDAYMRGGDKR